MSGTAKTLTLSFPIELLSAQGEVVERITELTLDRLKGAAARKVLNASKAGAGDFTAALVCESARIPPSTFDKLDAEDIGAAMEIASGFFGSALPTSSS